MQLLSLLGVEYFEDAVEGILLTACCGSGCLLLLRLLCRCGVKTLGSFTGRLSLCLYGSGCGICGSLLKAGGNDGDSDLVLHGLVEGCTEDDVCIGVSISGLATAMRAASSALPLPAARPTPM